MAPRKHRSLAAPKYVSTADAKRRLGNPGNGLFWKLAAKEFGPPVRLSDRKLIWDVDKLDAFIERRAREGYTPHYTSGMVGHDAKLDVAPAESASE